MSIAELERRARAMRRDIVRLSYQAKTGHIGSSLSCADLMAGVFFRFLNLPNVSSPTRDRFLMSKGHACVPLYWCLAERGFLPREVLEAYGVEGSALGHHPKRNPEFGIEFGTGSLGHGLSLGCGLAFAAKASGAPQRIVVMMSDGEQQEGTVWEAATFAAQHRLENVLAIVDFNKMQALGDTHEIANLEPLEERYRAFGWGVRRIDGHDMRAVTEALDAFPFEKNKPSVIVADTIKGKGVSFMQSSLLWHYRCPDEKEYAAAMKELDGDA